MDIPSTGQQVSVLYENFTLRGCSLRNTAWVIGLVTYVGNDTRIMRNSAASRIKKSNLENQTSLQVFLIFCTELVLCFFASSYVVIWVKEYQVSSNVYLGFSTDASDLQNSPGHWTLVWIANFGTWLLIFTNMVPISLLVTLEFVKFFQALNIGWDANIYSVQIDMPTKVQSSNLNEELGQIEYIFSDKTGTLTQNIMDFRKMSAGLVDYGSSVRIENDKLLESQKCKGSLVKNVNLDMSKLKDDLRPGSKNFEKVEEMMLNLCLNHSVLIGRHGYSATSPDELALVNAAKFCGYEFVSRESKDNSVVIRVDGEAQRWHLL